MFAIYKDLNMQRSIQEIGSEFWIEQEPENLSTERDGVYAISGRTAIDLILQDILKKRPVRRVYMPAWCCDSMIAPFLGDRIEIKFYDVTLGTRIATNDHEFSFNLSRILETFGTSEQVRARELENNISSSIDILYVTNYFGYENTLSIETVRRFKENGAIVLYDRTHSFLMEDEEYQELADYYFASIRKWIGVVGGAVVNGLTEKPTLKECPYSAIKEKAMREKYQYLQGDTSVVKGDFLKAFGEFGHHLSEDYQNYAMDNLSYALYQQVDLNAMAKKRRENAAYLHQNLKGVKFIGEQTDKAVPLFVPIFFESKEKRDAVRKTLIENQIYCPVHWPKPQQIPADFAANQIVDTELSVICDQRYGLTDMERIVTQISQITQK